MKPIIHCRVILEMLGAPKDYIEETLKTYVEKLKKEGLHVLTEVYAEAIKKEELYSTFCEMEIQFAQVKDLLDFCFDSMPSSVEILAPEEITLPANDVSDFLNDLQAKIHEVDYLVKNIRAENRILDVNATNILHNFILALLATGPKTGGELAHPLGLQQVHVEKFLAYLLEKNKVIKDGERYILTHERTEKTA